ncbi:MAG TPA: cation diffusion facilitator family transporter [Deferrisomatales bacterium]|nr:cation diffusion facilitator family transporter [Deferrisomatales bacterium]
MGYRKEDACATSRRTAEVKRVLWIILFLNVAVAAGKFFYGLFIDSVSMQADGFHSMFDGTSNVIGLVGMSFAARPADRGHPYGHGKYETYVSAIIGAMLLMAAWKIGSAAVGKLFAGVAEPPRVDAAAFAVMVVTLLVNIFVAWYERRKGLALQSDILVADASHTGSDILVSSGVLVGLCFVKLGMPLADPIIALLVVAAILWSAWGVFGKVNRTFSDSAILPVGRVCGIAERVEGVRGCHSIRTRGPSAQIHIDLHIQVDPELTVAAGHAIAEEVEEALCEGISGVVDVIAHLEPWDEYQQSKTQKQGF